MIAFHEVFPFSVSRRRACVFLNVPALSMSVVLSFPGRSSISASRLPEPVPLTRRLSKSRSMASSAKLAPPQRTRRPEPVTHSTADPAPYHEAQTRGDEQLTDMADVHCLPKKGSNISIDQVESHARQQGRAESQQQPRFSDRSQTRLQ